MTQPAITFDSVHYAYGTTDVLDGVSFGLDAGTFTALIGPNGAGKTTLLRLLLGLIKPRAGQIRVFGRTPGERGLRVGFVPQKTGVPETFPLSVRELATMGRYPRIGWGRRPGERDRQVVASALDRVGLGEIADRRFGDLSGGQQRRALIARALVAEPALLLLDEPTAGLDPAGQARFYDMCCTLQREEGLTLLAASHDIDVVARHANTVLLIDRSVRAIGSPLEVLESERLDRVYKFPHGHVHRRPDRRAGE